VVGESVGPAVGEIDGRLVVGDGVVGLAVGDADGFKVEGGLVAVGTVGKTKGSTVNPNVPVLESSPCTKR
jgi:hypothetical protein